MLTKENLLNFSHKNTESSWLTNLRIKAFERLEELDYPKMQRFSYHDWPLIKKEDFPWSNQADFYLNEEENILENIGIILTDIFAASNNYHELVQSTLGSVIKHNEDQLTAYHYAYLYSGLFLYIPKDTILTEPITISLSPTPDTSISLL